MFGVQGGSREGEEEQVRREISPASVSWRQMCRHSKMVPKEGQKSEAAALMAGFTAEGEQQEGSQKSGDIQKDLDIYVHT